MSRPYTVDEMRKEFVDHIKSMVNYWDNENTSSKDKLEGLAFSILNTLDGGAAMLPGYKVIANVTEDDVRYHKERDENYYPVNGEDIAGCLHELFVKD